MDGATSLADVQSSSSAFEIGADLEDAGGPLGSQVAERPPFAEDAGGPLGTGIMDSAGSASPGIMWYSAVLCLGPVTVAGSIDSMPRFPRGTRPSVLAVP